MSASAPVLAAPAGRPAWWAWLSTSTLAYGIAAVFFAALVLVPGFMLLKASVLVDGGAGQLTYGWSGWREALGNEAVRAGLVNTFMLMLAAQMISIPLAVFVSWLLARTNLPARGWMEFGFWVSFFLPALAVVQGWVLMLDRQFGLVNVALRQFLPGDEGPFSIFSWWGIVFAHLVTTTVSAKVMMMTPAFHAMDARYEEAARMAGDSPMKTLRRIVVPILAPAILVTSTMGIIRALESFEIELVLGPPCQHPGLQHTDLQPGAQGEPRLHDRKRAGHPDDRAVDGLGSASPLANARRQVHDHFRAGQERAASPWTLALARVRLRLSSW